MQLLNALAKTLIEAQLVLEGKLDAYSEGLTLEKVFTEDDNGLLIGWMNYRAIFELENFSADSKTLMVCIAMFLNAEDAHRDDKELPDPEFVTTKEGDGSYTVSVQIDFSEPLYVHESSTGAFSYNGKKYSMGDSPMSVAEFFGVVRD